MPFQPVPRTLYTTGVSDPTIGPEWMICLSTGKCWDLYEGQTLCPLDGNWGWDWNPASTATRIEIARDLSDEEIASLNDPETRPGAIARILEARKPVLAPSREDASETEAEIERWKQAARRLEAEAAEAGALVLSHEGRIERLQRDLEAAQADVASLRGEVLSHSQAAEYCRSMIWRCLEKLGGKAGDLPAAVDALIDERDRYRAIVREALEVAHAGEAADERLPEIVQDLDRSLGALEDEQDRLRAIVVGLAAKLAGVDG